MSDDEYETFDNVTIKHVTDKGGVLVKFEEGGEHWLPAKAIHDDSDVFKKGDSGSIAVCNWWLEDNPQFGE